MPLSPLNQNQGFPVGKNHLDEILAKNRRVVHYLISQASAVFEPRRSFLEMIHSIHKNRGGSTLKAGCAVAHLDFLKNQRKFFFFFFI
jgi:hypothetical protein